jgi:demethylmenaquinone methyltransferase/2-methoxy-6-polyprenyl-1,4-benzoquinol methylase
MSRKDYFNKVAETWDQEFSTPYLIAFLEKFVPRFGLKAGDRVLDLGTGTGVIIPFLIQIVKPSGSITAIDYSKKMVQISKGKYSHLPNVTIKHQDVEKIDFPPESFDAVTCFGLFPHLENKVRALLQMNRVLIPGGRLIIAHALSSKEIKLRHLSRKRSPVSQDKLPQKSEMIRLLKKTGFEKISIKDEPGSYLCLSFKSRCP